MHVLANVAAPERRQGGAVNNTDPDDEQPQLTWLWRRSHAPDGSRAECKTCGTVTRFHRLRTRPAYACDRCGAQIRPTSGTPFAGSSTPLAKWFEATAILVGPGPRPTPRRLADRLGVDYKAAWRMTRRIDEALEEDGDGADLLRAVAAEWEPATKAPADAAPQRNGEQTVDRIRAAACRALARRGLARARIADIAREAEVSSAVVHYYFRSKDEVLLSAMQWASEQLQKTLDWILTDSSDPLTQLRLILSVSAPVNDGLRDEYMLWLDFWSLVRIDAKYLPECEAMSASWKRIVVDVLQRGVEQGVFHPAAPVEDIAQMYVSLSESFAYRCVIGYEEMPVTRALELLAAFLAGQLGLSPAQVRP
jgi:AcrR family transcriptional regulator